MSGSDAVLMFCAGFIAGGAVVSGAWWFVITLLARIIRTSDEKLRRGELEP